MREAYSPTPREKRTPVRRGEGLGVEKPQKSRLSDTTTERPLAFAPVPKVRMEQRQKPDLDYSGLYMPVVSDIQRDMAKWDLDNNELAKKSRIAELGRSREEQIQRERIAKAAADFKQEYTTRKELSERVRQGEKTDLPPDQIWWAQQRPGGQGRKKTWKDRLHQAVGTVTDFLGF